MSYLNLPRLVFAGQFQADPSTVNNDPEHFNINQFQSNYTLPGPGASNGWWNPGGTAAWRFFECKVRRVMYQDGTFSSNPEVDPVVGAPVNGSNIKVEGKLVDLDPEQQMVSEIWGFQVVLGSDAHSFSFRSNFEVAPFADIWTRYPSGQADSYYGAFYQSVLHIVDWKNLKKSRFMEELAQVLPSDGLGMLSIKFNVDGYNDDSTTPTFTLGRVVGSIGPYNEGEPKHFVAGRYLPAPSSAQTPWGSAYAVMQDHSLVLDLGNSLPTKSAGGAIDTSPGSIYAAVVSLGQTVLLGEIEYQSPDWYQQTAGIVSLPLSNSQSNLAKINPLLVQGASSPPYLAEVSPFARADKFVFRLDAGMKESTTFYATELGRRAAHQQISLAPDSTLMQQQQVQGPVPGPPAGIPATALTFPASITTDSNGTAALQLATSNPGNPRKYIDGQVYGVTYGPGPTPPPSGSVTNPSQILNAVVFSAYEIPEQPNWLEHVQPIFQQYADLYPVMRPIVDLSNFANVIERLNILKNVFSTPVTSPNYMPVTRDLSGPKRKMILKWLDHPLYMNLDSAADLMQALQVAIELEHSTIPPYLCALYSIQAGTNVEVAELIRSVVIEEMLHMALACNILISIGGNPKIGHAKFVPTYPGPLPGGLRSGLIVHLRRCSIQQIRDCFMSIEEPEETAEIRRRRLTPNYPFDPHLFTIGWFYDEISKSLTELSNQGAITFGNTDKQVSEWSGLGKLYVISSLQDALNAITEIKEQGEGSGPFNPDDPQKELAHYYKFAEIVAGRHLVKTEIKTEKGTEKTFSYTGAPIPFDPDSVWPMIDDPNIVLYPQGSRAQILSMQFAQTYQALLKGLNRTFNGEPQYLREAIGLMYSLDLAARQLMQTPSGIKDGTTAGPSFQLPVPGLRS
jgi:hypothetical protein